MFHVLQATREVLIVFVRLHTIASDAPRRASLAIAATLAVRPRRRRPGHG